MLGVDTVSGAEAAHANHDFAAYAVGWDELLAFDR